MSDIDKVYFVECFDPRGGIDDAVAGHIGASVYWANRSAFRTLAQAKRCARTCQKEGIAVSIKEVRVL